MSRYSRFHWETAQLRRVMGACRAVGRRSCQAQGSLTGSPSGSATSRGSGSSLPIRTVRPPARSLLSSASAALASRSFCMGLAFTCAGEGCNRSIVAETLAGGSLFPAPRSGCGHGTCCAASASCARTAGTRSNAAELVACASLWSRRCCAMSSGPNVRNATAEENLVTRGTITAT